MKKAFFMFVAFVFTLAAMAQTPAEKRDLHHDLAKERNKRHEVARDLARGNLGEAKADHRAAKAYHREVHQDVHNIHARQARKARQHAYAHRRYVHKHHRRRHYR
jgi:hypothetical protein